MDVKTTLYFLILFVVCNFELGKSDQQMWIPSYGGQFSYDPDPEDAVRGRFGSTQIQNPLSGFQNMFCKQCVAMMNGMKPNSMKGSNMTTTAAPPRKLLIVDEAKIESRCKSLGFEEGNSYYCKVGGNPLCFVRPGKSVTYPVARSGCYSISNDTVGYNLLRKSSLGADLTMFESTCYITLDEAFLESGPRGLTDKDCEVIQPGGNLTTANCNSYKKMCCEAIFFEPNT